MPRHPTPAQREASRRNGRKSQGPVSAEGRAKVSANALRHGLRAERHLLLAEERAEELEAFAAALRAELAPGGLIAAQLVEQIIAVLWRLRRVPEVERRLLEAQRYRGERRFTAAELLLRDLAGARSVLGVSEYEQRLLRQLRRLFVALEKCGERTRESGATA